jgi:hypothetical protein
MAARVARCPSRQKLPVGPDEACASTLPAPAGTPDPSAADVGSESEAATAPARGRLDREPSAIATSTSIKVRRYARADLLRRVFALEVSECPRCGGQLRILAAIHPPDATRAILDCLGLPSRAPPLAPARPITTPADR